MSKNSPALLLWRLVPMTFSLPYSSIIFVSNLIMVLQLHHRLWYKNLLRRKENPKVNLFFKMPLKLNETYTIKTYYKFLLSIYVHLLWIVWQNEQNHIHIKRLTTIIPKYKIYLNSRATPKFHTTQVKKPKTQTQQMMALDRTQLEVCLTPLLYYLVEDI